MERLSSRQNPLIRHVRRLGTERKARDAAGEYVCAGEKLLREALRAGETVTSALWAGEPSAALPEAAQYLLPEELLEYVSPLKTAGDVVFTVKKRNRTAERTNRVLVLETVQDPGNLGTILRTANALCTDLVILTGDCADAYNPKAVRATMGAVFRQPFMELATEELGPWLSARGLRLYGAALSPDAVDLRAAPLKGAAVAMGSEGRGLSPGLRSQCAGEVIIPMNPACESLNVASAAAIVLWELFRAGEKAADAGAPADRRI